MAIILVFGIVLMVFGALALLIGFMVSTLGVAIEQYNDKDFINCCISLSLVVFLAGLITTVVSFVYFI